VRAHHHRSPTELDGRGAHTRWTREHCGHGELSLPGCPPGPCLYARGFDPKITQDTIQTTICIPGWSKQARPPVTVTEPIKRERVRAYGVSVPLSSVELDHLGPVSLGGLTTTANLWPENWDGPEGVHGKDVLEEKVHTLECNGTLRSKTPSKPS
jgi:hypothetical protein